MLNKNKGFTLFETIIAVGMISLASVVILQIFYTAGSLSHRATDIDTANNILTQAIDVSKNARNVEDIFSNDEVFLNSFMDENNDTEALKTAYVYYDDEWVALEKSGDEIPENSKFVIKYELLREKVNYVKDVYDNFEITSDGTTYNVENVESQGALYTLNATVTIVDDYIFTYSRGELDSDILVTLNGSKFISGTEEE